MVSVTDAAKEKMLDVLVGDQASFLRFGLQGGGCSGFQYYFAIEENKEEDDHIVQLDDTHSLLVDSASMMYLHEAVIDYKKDLMGESFVFKNPNVSNQCGCGNSVSF